MKRLLRATVFVLTATACASAPRPAAIATATSVAEPGRYVFAYFKGNGEDGVHLAYSEDGLAWRALNGDSAVFKPSVGKEKLARDPSVVRGPDGVYHMVWTAGWNEHGFGLAHSRDLVTWTGETYVPVMAHEPSALNTWAPEIFYDAPRGRYLIYWATTIPGRFKGDDVGGGNGKYNHRIYYVTTKDFTSFSKAKVLYDQSFSVIDAFIIRDGDRHVMFLKDETEKPPKKDIHMAYAGGNPDGYWSYPGTRITGDYWAEGPSALRVGNRWIVYFDRYRDHRYGALSSPDLRSWGDITAQLKIPEGMRHGTAFRVPLADAERLLARDRR